MTTDVAQALEVITAALTGMAVLLVLLVLAERSVLRPPASTDAAQPAAAPVVTAADSATAEGEATAPA